MPLYVIGVLAAFVEPIFHGGSNIIDHFLSSKVVPRLATLIFFGSSIGVVFTTMFVFTFDPPHLLPAPLLFIAFLVACIEIGYLFPYYYSLRKIDTSIVASLFSLGKIFVPVLAFIALGERLAPIQYAGFFLIIISSCCLSLDVRKLRLNPAFFLMLFVSLILAFETILYKYAFTSGATWSSFIFSMNLLEWVLAGILLLCSGGLQTIHSDFSRMRKNGWLFWGNEVLGWGGNVADSFALSILPVTVSRAIGSTQSIFVLLYAYVFEAKRQELFKEGLKKSEIIKKISFFGLIIIGVIMVVAFGSAEI